MENIIKEISVKYFTEVLKISASQNGTFRTLLTIPVEEDNKPLLILGNAHSKIEDGHCIAILNPDEDIVENKKVIAGCSYGNYLKEIVSGKCDLMLEIWIDAYKENGVTIISSYKSKTPKPAKFTVK